MTGLRDGGSQFLRCVPTSRDFGRNDGEGLSKYYPQIAPIDADSIPHAKAQRKISQKEEVRRQKRNDENVFDAINRRNRIYNSHSGKGETQREILTSNTNF
jgi:hypothetical protein